MAEGAPQNRQAPLGGSAAIDGQHSDSNQPAEEVWNEERLERAMKTLKEMHIQVSRLRCTSMRKTLILYYSYEGCELQFLD